MFSRYNSSSIKNMTWQRPFNALTTFIFILTLSLLIPIEVGNADSLTKYRIDEPASAITTKNLRVAFQRDGMLWIKTSDEEKVISEKQSVRSPEWSRDGRWLAYSVSNKKTKSNHKNNDTSLYKEELLVYDTETENTYSLFHNGYNYQWAPDKNILAFQGEAVLNVIDLRDGKPSPFFNVALGVSNYAWEPHGNGFILSANGQRRPDGWTNPILYKIDLDQTNEKKNQYTLKDGKEFFTIPGKLKKGDMEILSIGANKFQWSPSRKWISFLVFPTASWAMDSNMLVVLSSDGMEFVTVDEMAGGFPFQWAPSKDLLAYIEGGGRIIFGFKNKQMKIKEFVESKRESFTPPNFIDLSFAWLDNNSVAVSRAPEKNWSNNPAKRIFPSLYQIDIFSQTQQQITEPPEGWGDFLPVYFTDDNLLAWVRSNWETNDIWIGSPDGTRAEKWIKNVEQQEKITWFR